MSAVCVSIADLDPADVQVAPAVPTLHLLDVAGRFVVTAAVIAAPIIASIVETDGKSAVVMTVVAMSAGLRRCGKRDGGNDCNGGGDDELAHGDVPSVGS